MIIIENSTIAAAGEMKTAAAFAFLARRLLLWEVKRTNGRANRNHLAGYPAELSIIIIIILGGERWKIR